MPADFYRNILYPLQDKALAAFRDTAFYLTGGTALSRGYYHHRYSDDLDLFVNDAAAFHLEAERAISRLNTLFEEFQVVVRDPRYYRMYAGPERLKIELVNDVPAHIGEIVTDPVLGRIDSRENILANKITAVIDRGLPKDIVDI